MCRRLCLCHTFFIYFVFALPHFALLVFFAMCNSFLLACRWSAPLCGPLSCASLYEKLPYLRWGFFWCFMFKKKEESMARRGSEAAKKYQVERKILHKISIKWNDGKLYILSFYNSLEWIMYVSSSSHKRVSLRPCSTFISLSREREKRMLLGYNKTKKLRWRTGVSVSSAGMGAKKRRMKFQKNEKEEFSSFFVCWSFSISFYTFAARVLAAVAGCMREQNRNYVDCEKTKNGIGANTREIKFNYKLKIVGNQKDGKGKRQQQHTWKEEKRFRAPQWDLCEMMGMRWRKILLSDSIARRRAAAITDNVRKKKELVKNDICDVTLALRRVESCPAYTQTR